MFSRWCGMVVRRGECQLRCRPPQPWLKITTSVAESPRVDEQCENEMRLTRKRLKQNNTAVTLIGKLTQILAKQAVEFLCRGGMKTKAAS
ncbi:hypothetical protein TNCV_869951 [Trichonephila clavipes]|nr:hypothetical protein TNCV_869951 [Trichonephila clavipes]